METVVVLEQVGRIGEGELAEGVVKSALGQVGIELSQGGAQAAGQNDIPVAFPLRGGAVRSEVGATGIGIAHLAQPLQGGEFDVGFVKAVGGHRLTSAAYAGIASAACAFSWLWPCAAAAQCAGLA